MRSSKRAAAVLSAAALLLLPALPAEAAEAATTFTFGNLHSGKCLEVAYSGTADLADVGQYTCHSGNNQKWELVQVTVAPGQPNNRMMLRNQNSGKCLEILNYSTADFGEAVQYGCYEGANQVWASPQWFWPT
ncbi:RICIN domain-containing protein [Streptosporangium sandarakinum]|uniref:RICIN domain-containing protein n=1 Tax=Streptosporangium sandarakinum TaxID=1260955 RepID=UPI00367E6EEB